MAAVFIGLAIILLLITVVSVGVGVRDALRRREHRHLGEIAADGIPLEIEDLPSNEDGSTSPEGFPGEST